MGMASNRSTLLLVLALLTTWFGWGSSFFAMTFALDAMPPLLMMGTRFITAGVLALLLAKYALRSTFTITLPVLRDAAIVGATMVTVGMGATAWGAARLDSGITALLSAAAPLWIVGMGAVLFKDIPHRLALLGLGVGIAGAAALTAPGGGGSISTAGLIAIAISSLAWAGASLHSRRTASSGDALADTALRMLLGGVLLIPCSFAIGEWSQFDAAAIDGAAVASWCFLVVVCAIGGFLAYEWLLTNVTSSLASTYAFVNPVVALGLGAVLLDEAVSMRTVLAGVAVVIAVVLLMLGERRATAAAALLEAQLPIAEAQPTRPATRAPARRRAVARRPMAVGRPRTGMGFDATPTPAFARRTERPWQATDGMDALAIDVALDRGL